jgi:membrane dipeptidase
MIRAIADSGGVVQINFSAGFVDPDFPHIDTKTFERWWKLPEEQRGKLTDHMTPLSLLVDHVDHAVQLVGPEHVGIGSDFDGVYALPEGMEDCSKLPSLTAALLERGYAADDLRKVLGENVLRVMDACTAVARVS